MEQNIVFNDLFWYKRGDTAHLIDARCILGSDPSYAFVPEAIQSDDGDSTLKVTGISPDAFEKCQFVRHVHLPQGITDEWSEIKNLPILESISISEDNKVLTSKDGVLYTKDLTKILYRPPAKTDFKCMNSHTLFAYYV